MSGSTLPVLATLTDACGEDPGNVCEWVYDLTGENDGLTEVIDWLIARPLNVLLILLGAAIVSRLARRWIRRWTRSLVERGGQAASPTGVMVLSAGPASVRAATRAETIGAVMRGLATALVWTVAFFLVLGVLDVDLAPLIAGAGIAGVALGFGAQTLVKDFLSGFFMLVEDQFGVGDVVDLGEATGTVEAFTLRATRLRGIDGTVWHVPNGEIQRVGNMSQQWARVLLDISVAYDADLRQAQEVIKQVADEVFHDDEWGSYLLEEPEIWGVEALDVDGIAIRLVIKTQPGEQWKVMRELRLRIKEALDRAGIEIPFSQRTVWLRHDGGGPGEAGSGDEGS